MNNSASHILNKKPQAPRLTDVGQDLLPPRLHVILSHRLRLEGLLVLLAALPLLFLLLQPLLEGLQEELGSAADSDPAPYQRGGLGRGVGLGVGGGMSLTGRALNLASQPSLPPSILIYLDAEMPHILVSLPVS